MNLLQLKTEVEAHGFADLVWGARITQYLNDAQSLIARRADYYIDEAINQFATTSGTDTYAWPANLARIRSLFDTDRRIELAYASLEQMDRSVAVNGTPVFYATVGKSLRLYPVPDSVYNLELRYWAMPPTLVADTDTPTLPADYHQMLWVYAVAQCYKGDDDMQTGQQWMQDFQVALSQFEADQKFVSDQGPTQASGMWDTEGSLDTGRAWTRSY